MQIRRCVINFCQIDKISQCICIFDDAEIYKFDKISNVATNGRS